jgi:hypothetical protein
MRNSFIISLLLLCFTISLNSFSQSKIERSKKDLGKGSPTRESGRNRRTSPSSPNYERNWALNNTIFEGIVQGCLFVTYYAAIGNYRIENHLHNKLTSYPFFDNIKQGNYEIADAESRPGKIFRIDLTEQYLYSDENLHGNHFKLKLRPFQYFYLQTDYLRLIEKGIKVNSYPDLTLFNFNFCYDRVRLENFNLGWSLGCNYIGSDVKKAGFSYGLHAELFLAKNLSLTGEQKWSLINNQQVNQLELQGKYHIKRGFLSMGYEHLRIASPTYDFISMGGGVYL